MDAFGKLVASLDYRGSVEFNWLLPGPAGAVHPTCLAPVSLANGELSSGGRMLIVGFHELRDFYPALISQNLNAQKLSVQTAAQTIDLPAPRVLPRRRLSRSFSRFARHTTYTP